MTGSEMTDKPAKFSKTNVKRLVNTARELGVDVNSIEVRADGSICVSEVKEPTIPVDEPEDLRI